ncbi:unnamed protein product [Closterium sp. Naga37s-1]|nr:unnamed protein product [Closterium sp. Naga37s-1]
MVVDATASCAHDGGEQRRDNGGRWRAVASVGRGGSVQRHAIGPCPSFPFPLSFSLIPPVFLALSPVLLSLPPCPSLLFSMSFPPFPPVILSLSPCPSLPFIVFVPPDVLSALPPVLSSLSPCPSLPFFSLPPFPSPNPLLPPALIRPHSSPSPNPLLLSPFPKPFLSIFPIPSLSHYPVPPFTLPPAIPFPPLLPLPIPHFRPFPFHYVPSSSPAHSSSFA